MELVCFFFNDTATTEIYTLSLHDALPISIQVFDSWVGALGPDDYVRYVAPYSRALIERIRTASVPVIHFGTGCRSEEHTSELQSHLNIVCRLLLAKKTDAIGWRVRQQRVL